MSEPQPATSVTGATVGGHLTKKQRKEQFEALDALKTQLDVSVSLARTKVASWLSGDGFSDDEADNGSSSPGSFASGATVIKPRQERLGLGAKFISHKDAMRHMPANAFESKLKRQLTGGIIAGEIQRQEAAEKNALPDKYQQHKLMMAEKRREAQEQAEDEEDSRTRNIVALSSTSASVTKPTGKKMMTHPSIHNKSHPAAATIPSQQPKQKQDKAYVPKVHPAALKAAPSEDLVPTSSTNTKPSGSNNNKRRPDFFNSFMDQRAEKMAKKKKKTQAKNDSDDE
ncbi:hypothetical protein BGZ83_001984 [Gryganskiella cystojenkinii]|nr:hypothetical protein BGZ83_001984 [Gryganskiella cystojenkinii]